MPTATPTRVSLTVGDAVWIAVALLHKQHPEQPGFSVSQIVQQVQYLELTDKEEISIYIHANQHCVANRPPNQAKLRMLVETPDGGRRLYCSGDKFDPQRDGRTTPKPSTLPAKYLPLLNWYATWCKERRATDFREDPLLALRGSGRELWADEHADQYIANLRKEWV